MRSRGKQISAFGVRPEEAEVVSPDLSRNRKLGSVSGKGVNQDLRWEWFS